MHLLAIVSFATLVIAASVGAYVVPKYLATPKAAQETAPATMPAGFQNPFDATKPNTSFNDTNVPITPTPTVNVASIFIEPTPTVAPNPFDVIATTTPKPYENPFGQLR